MSYDSIIGHRTMALDGVRNAAYQAALESIITPDSVVLDLGAGLGTLGMLAARLGARRVYLVEPSNVVSVTRELVHRNGLQARVRVLQGRIEDLELPEPVDVITSVMTGNFLLSEDLLPSLFHARDKYLKPGGRLLPSEAVMEVMPVSLPTYYAEHVACWQQPHLGLDFGAAQEAATNSIYWSRSKFAAATPLAPAQPLLHMDLDAAQSTHCRATTEFSLTTDGSLHGWLGWFRMQLGEAWLSTSPFEPLTHWGSAFLPLPQAQDGHAGDAAGFSLLRPPGGPWSWTTTLDGRVFRQSTFRAATLSPARLASLAEAAQPSLTPTGVCVRATLDAMDGATSIKEIASRLQAAHPEAVPDEASALRLIRDATDRYAARSPGPDDRVQPPAPPA